LSGQTSRWLEASALRLARQHTGLRPATASCRRLSKRAAASRLLLETSSMRRSPLSRAALTLVRSAIDRVWPEQVAYAWDSKPPAVIGVVERPTHELITN